MTHSNAFPQIQSKCKILLGTIELNRHLQNPAEYCTQVYKKDTNNILWLNFDPIYVHLYALFPWVIIPYWLDKHTHGGYSDYDVVFSFSLTPYISCIIQSRNPYTIVMRRRIVPAQRINLAAISDSIRITLSWRSSWMNNSVSGFRGYQRVRF